jgi:hypothetical protein
MLKRVAGWIERYAKDRLAIRDGDQVLVLGHPEACLVTCSAWDPVRAEHRAVRPGRCARARPALSEVPDATAVHAALCGCAKP